MVVFTATELGTRARIDLSRDLNYALENWRIAYALFTLQEAIVQQRVATLAAGQLDAM